MSLIVNLIFLLILPLTTLAIGAASLRRVPIREIDLMAVCLYSTAVGLGLIGICVAIVGIAGAFIPLAGLFVSVVLGDLVGIRAKHNPLRDSIARWWNHRRRSRPDVAGWVLGAVVLAYGVLTLTGALAPPTSNEWDTLAYHFAAPKVWLHDHRIHMLPYDNHAGFPMLTEMLYSFGLSAGNLSDAKLVHWFYGMLCALTCYWAGRHWVSRKAGLLAAALFLACPVVGWEATTAYIDLAATLYVSLSVFAFARWIESSGEGDPAPSSGWLWLAGICGGLACGVKMTMIATSGLLVLWAIALTFKGRVSWKQVGLLTGLMLVIGAPWYIKTWIWTGNPFYPFAYSLFGGKWWGAAQAAQYAAEQGRFGIGKTLYGLWVAPWSTAFQAQYYANPPSVFRGVLEAATGNAVFPAVFGTLGVGLIGLLPLWFLAPRRPERGAAGRSPVWLAAYGGAFVLVWFALTHQTRYLIPILPVLLIPAVAGARAFWHEGRWWRVGLGAFCSLALLWGLVPLNALVEPCWAVAWGGESQDAYLSRMEPTYNICKAANAQLPAASRILLLNEVRGFYLDRPYQWGDASQNTLIPWEAIHTPQELDRALRSQGITHVLINGNSAPSPSERWPELARLAIGHGEWREVIREKGFAVYAVRP